MRIENRVAVFFCWEEHGVFLQHFFAELAT